MDNENEITLDNGNKIVISLFKENGYSITKASCFRAGDEMNIRQNLLDIAEGCQKELEVIYEHEEHKK